MWHALRAELVYSRPYLLGGWGIAVGVMAIISVVFFAVGDDGPPSSTVAGLRGMFVIMAPLIVSFIAQALRSEERRARLLLVGSLTPRQLAGAMVLLPAIMFGLGIVAAGLVMGAGALATGSFEPKSLNIATSVGGYLLVYAQIALLLQEANAARRQARQRAAVAGWAGVVIAALFLAVLYLAQARGLLTSAHLMVGHLLVVVAAMAATVQLYSGRRDFTR
jgi:hypothetical protein